MIGASGTIGAAVRAALDARGHAVVPASRSGPLRVNLEQTDTIDALFPAVPGLDAVICCAASAPLSALDAGTDEEFTRGLHGKLLGQVLLLRRAIPHLPDGGSVPSPPGPWTG